MILGWKYLKQVTANMQNNSLATRCGIALWWMRWMLQSQQKVNTGSVMAWNRQATSHYQSQCWTRSMTPYGASRPQWVNWIATINLNHRSSGALYTTINYVYKSRMRHLTDYGSKIDMLIKVRFMSLQLTNTDMIDNHNTLRQNDGAVMVCRKYINHVGNYFDSQKWEPLH